MFIVDSGCTKHMTGNLKLLTNFVKKFLDLEVAFRKSTCFVRDIQGNNLLTDRRGSDLYIIELQESSSTTPICFMAKASSSQAWLWHHRLSHLNFDTINLLSKKNIVIGLPQLKFIKDHLCSSCELGKAKYTWTHFLRSKDETSEVLINLLRMIQRGLQAQVRTMRTDKGTEFLNKTLQTYFSKEGIHHQTSIARTPEQKGVAERRNHTLIEAARTMISTHSRGYRVFNKRTRIIVETIHVNFDELQDMASNHVSSDPAPQCQRKASEDKTLVPEPQSQENVPTPDMIVTMLSYAITIADASDKCQQQQETTSSTSTTVVADITQLDIQTTTESTTQAPTINADEDINQA
ncbi:retrovirus-related pol polyprotein from transposon TNT 1-94 [Tanacetum coccineum]